MLKDSSAKTLENLKKLLQVSHRLTENIWLLQQKPTKRDMLRLQDYSELQQTLKPYMHWRI